MPAADPHAELRDRLIAAEFLFPTGVEGLFGRSAAYPGMVDGIY
jgi:hypothetical protein